jgi:hypothetical protein
VAAACSAAAQTHEEAMKQALAARAALQVTSLAFDAAAGNNTMNSSSSMYIGNSNSIGSQQLVMMPDSNANAVAAGGVLNMSGRLGGGAAWDVAVSSAQALNHYSCPAGVLNMQQQPMLQQQQQLQSMQLQQQQEQEQQQQIMKLQQELAELQ